MEPIDSTVPPLNRHQEPSNSNSKPYVALLFANGLDRFAYYGFRSIIILALIDLYSIPENSIFGYYGTATGIIYFLFPIGGVLGDFVLKPRGALITGLSICTVGAVFTLFPNLSFLLIGIVLMMLGSGIVRPNVLSQINHLYAHDPDLLDRKYLILFMTTNLGAFLSITLIGYLTVKFGWVIGFALIGIAYAIATVILILTKSNSQKAIPVETARSPKRIYLSVLVIIPFILFSSVYWGGYELSYTALIDAEMNFRDQTSGTIISSLGGSMIINSIILIFGSVIMYYVINKRSKSAHWRFLVSGTVYSTIWLLAGISNDFIGASNMVVYITFIALIALSELVVFNAMYSILGKIIPLKITGTVSGVVLFLGAMGVKLISSFSNYEPPSSFYFFVLGGICAFSTFLFFFLIPVFSPPRRDLNEPF